MQLDPKLRPSATALRATLEAMLEQRFEGMLTMYRASRSAGQQAFHHQQADLDKHPEELPLGKARNTVN